MNTTKLMISSFTIITLNCKGLNNHEKRQKIFNLLKANHTDLICLQETNTNTNLSEFLTKSWHLSAT